MVKNKRFWITVSLLIMILIFWFSSRDATQSDAQSDWVQSLFPFLSGNDGSFIVRKTAHFTIYAGLGFSVYRSLRLWKLCSIQAFIWAVIICALYAASDELHQSLVPGRSCQFTDILLDTTGGCIGGICSYCIHKKWG